MPPQPSSFASRLTALREAAGLSQYALAKRAGLSKQALSNLELGNREPAWDTVQKLALALDVSCQEFLDGGVSIPTAEESAPGKPGRPRKDQAVPGTPPASDLEAEGRKRHKQQEPDVAKQMPERKGK